MTLAIFTILGLLAGSDPSPAAKVDADSISTPLYRYKLELARQERIYLQMVPEQITVHFQGLELKTIQVDRFIRLRDAELRRAGVVSWTPQPGESHLVARPAEPIPAVELLQSIVKVDEMPDFFSVRLDDGAELLVASEEGELRLFETLRENPPAGTATAFQSDLILIQMSPEAARQFFWLLEEGLSLVY